jgi:hypothetical protein
MLNLTKRLKPRDALEVSPFDTGIFTWKMKTRSIEENDWLQVDEGRGEDLLLKQKGPIGNYLNGSESTSLKLLETIESWLTQRSFTSPMVNDSLHPIDRCGRLIQEDVCLMERISESWVLTAASVCFPTHWDPFSKIGLALDDIHEPVPRYKEDLEPRPGNFMDRITDGMIVARTGWTLTACSDLALNFDHRVVEKDLEKDPSQLIMRVERQTLRRVPNSEAIVFTIRIHRWPLQVIRDDVELAKDLLASLKALPDEIKSYKSGTVKLSPLVQEYLTSNK